MTPYQLRDAVRGDGHTWGVNTSDNESSTNSDDTQVSAGIKKGGEQAVNAPSASVVGVGTANGASFFEQVVSDASLPIVFGLFLLAGLALTFTPCVLPMLPILSSILVGRSASKGQAFRYSSAYVGGVVAAYTALGVFIGLFGKGLNIQGYLQSPSVILVFSILFLMLALFMSGKVQLRTSGLSRFANMVDSLQGKLQRMGSPGIALAGALSVLVVSPCVSAPLAGVLMFISATGDAWVGGAALFSLSMGMGLPLVAAGTFGASLLPKAGVWMDTVKLLFAYMLAGVSIWLMGRILPEQATLLAWGALIVLVAQTLLRKPEGDNRPLWRRPASFLPLTVLLAIVSGVIVLSPSTAPDAGSSAVGASSDVVYDYDTLRERVDEAGKASGKPLMVNVTADWCPSCQAMKRRYAESEVAARLEGYEVVDVDVTDNSPEAREILGECDLFGPPGVFFFDEGERMDDYTIMGEMSSDSLIEHLEAVGKKALGEVSGNLDVSKATIDHP